MYVYVPHSNHKPNLHKEYTEKWGERNPIKTLKKTKSKGKNQEKKEEQWRTTKTIKKTINIMTMSTYLSIVTLSVNEVNAPNDTEEVEWVKTKRKKTHFYAANKDSLSIASPTDWKGRDGKDVPCSQKQKESWAGRYFHRAKRTSVLLKGISLRRGNICAPNLRTPKYNKGRS